MSNLVPNPPSFELAKKLAGDAPKPKRFPTTPLVRTALMDILSKEEHYVVLCAYYAGGDRTGSTQADQYFLASSLVDWEAEAGRTELHAALSGGVIRLVDIVKRLAPELRKLGFDVQRGVMMGMLENDSPEEEAEEPAFNFEAEPIS